MERKESNQTNKHVFDTYGNWFNLCTIFYFVLSHEVASESEIIMPCNKINKPQVVYRLACNVSRPL